MPGFAFPSVGPRGHGSPPSRQELPLAIGTMLGYDCRKPVSGLFGFPFPPPIPCFALLRKETTGSLKFPGHPRKHMPWSQTPVVSRILAITHPGLPPSGHSTPSAFPSGFPKVYPDDHDYTHFGAQYRACVLAFPGFRLPLPGLPAGSATDLPTRL